MTADDAKPQPPVFILRLTPARNIPEPARALARALKDVLRRHGFRCLDAREEAAE